MSSTRHSAEDVRRVAHHVRQYSVWCLLPFFHAWQLLLGGMGPHGGSNVQLDFANGSLIAVYIQEGACLGLNCWWYCSRSFHTWTPLSSAMTFQGTCQWISLAHLDSILVVVPTPPTMTIHNDLGALHTCVGGPAELYMKPRCIRVIRISCTDVSCIGMTAIFKSQTDCTHALRARASFRISLVGVVCSHSWSDWCTSMST